MAAAMGSLPSNSRAAWAGRACMRRINSASVWSRFFFVGAELIGATKVCKAALRAYPPGGPCMIATYSVLWCNRSMYLCKQQSRCNGASVPLH